MMPVGLLFSTRRLRRRETEPNEKILLLFHLSQAFRNMKSQWPNYQRNLLPQASIRSNEDCLKFNREFDRFSIQYSIENRSKSRLNFNFTNITVSVPTYVPSYHANNQIQSIAVAITTTTTTTTTKRGTILILSFKDKNTTHAICVRVFVHLHTFNVSMKSHR